MCDLDFNRLSLLLLWGLKQKVKRIRTPLWRSKVALCTLSPQWPNLRKVWKRSWWCPWLCLESRSEKATSSCGNQNFKCSYIGAWSAGSELASTPPLAYRRRAQTLKWKSKCLWSKASQWPQISECQLMSSLLRKIWREKICKSLKQSQKALKDYNSGRSCPRSICYSTWSGKLWILTSTKRSKKLTSLFSFECSSLIIRDELCRHFNLLTKLVLNLLHEYFLPEFKFQ